MSLIVRLVLSCLVFMSIISCKINPEFDLANKYIGRNIDDYISASNNGIYTIREVNGCIEYSFLIKTVKKNSVPSNQSLELKNIENTPPVVQFRPSSSNIHEWESPRLIPGSAIDAHVGSSDYIKTAFIVLITDKFKKIIAVQWLDLPA